MKTIKSFNYLAKGLMLYFLFIYKQFIPMVESQECINSLAMNKNTSKSCIFRSINIFIGFNSKIIYKKGDN